MLEGSIDTEEMMAVFKAGGRRFRSTWDFSLYVVNHTPKSIKAVRNLRTLCRESLGGKCRIEVIDIAKHPEAARTANIVAIPTLVKKHPLPMRTCIGDLSDLQTVLARLGLPSSAGIEPANA